MDGLLLVAARRAASDGGVRVRPFRRARALDGPLFAIPGKGVLKAFRGLAIKLSARTTNRRTVPRKEGKRYGWPWSDERPHARIGGGR